jgi:signal peptidase I
MKKTLKTGDFILFNTHSDNFLFKIFDMAIRWWTATPFTHCGFVIVNPPWAPVDTYVWDSSLHDFPDPSDKKIKFGVALVPFEHYHKTKSDLYVRKPQDNKTYDLFTTELVQNIHDKVYNDPYDTNIGDWVRGALKIQHESSDKKFVCSSFLQFILTQAGTLEKSKLMPSPGDFSQQNDNKVCKWIYSYKKEIMLS